MAHRIAGLDLSLAGTAAVVLGDDGSVSAMMAYSGTGRDHVKGQRPGLELHASSTVHRGDVVADFQRTCGIADAVQRFLRCHVRTGALIGIEDHAYGAKGASIYQLGHLHGMVRRDVVRNGYKFLLLNVKEVKQAATGAGNADKASMVKAASSAMNLDGLSVKAQEALADAYAVARLAYWFDLLSSGKESITRAPPDIASMIASKKNNGSLLRKSVVF